LHLDVNSHALPAYALEASAAKKEEMQILIACVALLAMCYGGNIHPHPLTAYQSPGWPAPQISPALTFQKSLPAFHDNIGNV